MKKIIWLLLFLFCVAFAITLFLKNPHQVQVLYYFGINWNVNVIVLMMGVFFSGVTFGLIVMYWSLLKQKVKYSAEHRKLEKVEKEVENLRALPLKDEV